MAHFFILMILALLMIVSFLLSLIRSLIGRMKKWVMTTYIQYICRQKKFWDKMIFMGWCQKIINTSRHCFFLILVVLPYRPDCRYTIVPWTMALHWLSWIALTTLSHSTIRNKLLNTLTFTRWPTTLVTDWSIRHNLKVKVSSNVLRTVQSLHPKRYNSYFEKRYCFVYKQ